MPCDRTPFFVGQDLRDRIKQVQKVVETVEKGMASGKIKIVVDKRTGAVAFQGLTDAERLKVGDACVYRKIMSGKNNAMARMKLAAAEQLAGRGVSKQAIAAGAHSHDGGITFHDHKG